MVGKEGLEPSRSQNQRILSPSRIPIPPLALIGYQTIILNEPHLSRKFDVVIFLPLVLSVREYDVHDILL